MRTGWVIISSHYINAWGLADEIFASGWSGRVICLNRTGEPFTLMSLYGRGVEVWEIPDAASLIDLLRDRIPVHDPKWLFFTEERSLEEVFSSSSDPWLENATWYPSFPCKLREVLDRFLFYQFIAANHLGETPRTISGTSDPFQTFDAQFFFRYRLTWVRGRKSPRIRLIRNRREWQMAMDQGKAQGFTPDDWCYQEPLSLSAQDNVSVCGWHDERQPRYLATRKVLQFPERQGNGDVCEVIDLTPSLEETTRNLLTKLSFTGPFELEFVRDLHTGRFFIIELNPRFWMQHPLAGGNLDHTPVRYYFGLDGDSGSNGSRPRYWVNTVVAARRLLHADFRGWKYLRSRDTLLLPPPSVTFRWIPRFSLILTQRRIRRA